jgi:hypothetical protein
VLLEIPSCIKPFSNKVGSSIPNRCDVSVLNSTVCYTASQFRIVGWLFSVGRTVFSSISLEFDSFPLRSVLDTTVCDKQFHWVTGGCLCPVGIAVLLTISWEFDFPLLWAALFSTVCETVSQLLTVIRKFITRGRLSSILNWTPNCYWNIVK